MDFLQHSRIIRVFVIDILFDCYFGFETVKTIMKDVNYEKIAEVFVSLCLSHKLKMMDAMSLADIFVISF